MFSASRIGLVVGLGNPGPRYASTRHNIGFRVVDALAERFGVPLAEERFDGRFGRGEVPALGGELALLQPLTYMNRSGEAVADATDALLAESSGFCIQSDLVVVYDDLDLPFPKLRLRAGGGPGGHRGMSDIIMCLESDEIARLRFGIGRPAPGQEVVDYVLEPFSADEERGLEQAIEHAADAVIAALCDGPGRAMSTVNRDEPAAPQS